MFETSLIEISESALKKNIRFLTKQLPQKTIFSSVIKGNAYGHGIDKFVPLAEKCGIRNFSVYSACEARSALRNLTASSLVTIMGALDNAEIPWAVENRIAFYIFDLDRLRHALNAARKTGIPACVHLEVETGLNRTGLTDSQLCRAVELIQSNAEYFRVDGICTHFAGAESLSNYLRIQHQIRRFESACNDLEKNGFLMEGITRHTACSAAALIYPETRMDMVRFGIAQYGFWPSKETEINFFSRKHKKLMHSRWKDPLVRVIKWKSRVMSTKRVRRGDYVGYGSSSLITRQTRIATVPVGYFHGFSRDLSNRGHVLIRGRRAPVMGLVNMNVIMVDITDIPNARKGDEVVMIGRQGDSTISVGSFGEMTRFINYELLVSLPSEIPRRVVA